MSMDDLFATYATQLETDAARRDAMREHTKALDVLVRRMQACVERVHGNFLSMDEFSTSVLGILDECAAQFDGLRSLCDSAGAYYEFKGLFNNSLKSIVFIEAFRVFVTENRLVGREELAEKLHFSNDNQGDAFRIELEDFLFGLACVPEELTRLCVNLVIRGDYESPARITTFVTDLSAGFRRLNLKNDSLRRKFDSIKYSTKKLEEIMFDLKVRGLIDG